jgi:hypothetical protein
LEKEATPGIDQNKLKNLLKNGPERKQRGINNPELEDFLNTLNVLDPYTAGEKEKILASQPPLPNKELEEKDIPTGVPPFIMEKLINERKKNWSMKNKFLSCKNTSKKSKFTRNDWKKVPKTAKKAF